MRYLFIFILFLFTFNSATFAVPFQGGVEKEILVGKSKVIDSRTGEPISGARVSMPLENYSTATSDSGEFNIKADLSGQSVVIVEKEGYKPYSVTVDRNDISRPMILGLEKSTPKDITLESQLFHLGDDNFSKLSANAGEFRLASIGPYYAKNFKLDKVSQGSKINLIIGSIMGVDTKLAKELGQNRVSNAYASAPEVYFNGNKIAEIQVNGDGQRIKIPYNLIRQGQNNQITIKTGRNLMQTSYVDYDDIELANISIETN